MAKFITMMYPIFFLLSIFAAITLYWFIHQYIQYMRLLRLKKIVTGEKLQNEDFLDKQSKLLNSKKFNIKIQHTLEMAGVKINITLFYSMNLVLFSILGTLFSSFLHHWFGFILGAIFSYILVTMFIKEKILQRKLEFNRSFTIAISVLVKMMRNGIGFEQALYKAVKTSNSKLFSQLFEQFFQEKNRIGEVEAFENMNRIIHSKELRIFALSVKIGRESGGHFSSTLEKVEETLRYRKKMQDKINVVTRESTIGSYVVASLNILLYFMIDMNFNGKVTEYFMSSEWGRWQLLGISLWMVIGLAVNRWLTRIQG
jgi:tight adherence protein B